MKKKFEIPELLIVSFADGDIILTSETGPGGDYGEGGDEGQGDYPY